MRVCYSPRNTPFVTRRTVRMATPDAIAHAFLDAYAAKYRGAAPDLPLLFTLAEARVVGAASRAPVHDSRFVRAVLGGLLRDSTFTAGRVCHSPRGAPDTLTAIARVCVPPVQRPTSRASATSTARTRSSPLTGRACAVARRSPARWRPGCVDVAVRQRWTDDVAPVRRGSTLLARRSPCHRATMSQLPRARILRQPAVRRASRPPRRSPAAV